MPIVPNAIKTVELQQAMRYMQVISIALLLYDWLLIFADEVKYIWTSRLTFVKLLYLWSRYSPIADTVLGFLSHFTFLSPQECKLNNTVNTFLGSAGIYSGELVLVWRTFALWQDSKRVRYGLGAVWALMFPLGLYSTVSFVTSTVYSPQLFPNQPGCNLVKGSSAIAGDFVGLVVLEITIVILTVVKAIHHAKGNPSLVRFQYVRTLYRDGVLFFICLTVLSVGNFLALFLGPKANALLLPTFLRVMHSTLCCRVILNLRSAASSDNELPQSIHPSRQGTGTLSALQFVASRTCRT
ncbi:hypothetical protein BDY19DRAFT_416377 [Irpex rosettiformis]|uniref:Uncharacterized protein n=1 Tax=Irpex rosettiformis TaxID=378272 RepID=A0ACB8UGR3_9APHY|nr:hypothetical protein BDY19DRAFT_416377 [Irpex rosettiformis]